MMNGVHLHYRKRPGLLFWGTFLAALKGRSGKFHGTASIPPISAELKAVKIDRDHLSRFNDMCHISRCDPISPIYPMTMVFPFFQKILSLKQAPLSLFNVLGKRLRIFQNRQVDPDETHDVLCKISGVRIVPNGLELDLSGTLSVDGEIVWTATETFFYRGNFGEPDMPAVKTDFEAVPDADMLARWYLKGGMGFRFAKVSGDGNGIHYSAVYARLLGFKRDFAQPFLILGRAVNHLTPGEGVHAVRLDAAFKGQFYYEKEVTVRGVKNNGDIRFDAYCQGNERPCINGRLKL